MPDVQYWESRNNLIFRTEDSNEFVSPATQEVLEKWKRPLWEPAHASRNDHLPHWKRTELFRTMTYHDTRRVSLSGPTFTAQSSIATPSGVLSLKNIQRPAYITLPDKELYHHDVQKVFCLMTQFDTLTEYQISAFTSLPLTRVDEVMKILHSQNIVKTPSRGWEGKEKIGKLWVLDLFSPSTYAYQSGLDSIVNIVSFGGNLLPDIVPPGSGSSSSIRHNLFMAETALRVAETADNVCGVWGDLYASESLFHEQNPKAKSRRSHGDAVVVTNNGSLVIFEMVGSMTESRNSFETIVEKAASWVGVIASSDLDISVLFVDSSWSKDRRKVIAAVEIGIRERSKVYAPEEFSRQKSLSHIGIVNLSHWYPDDYTVSQAQTRLLAFSPSLKKMKCFDEPDSAFSNDKMRKNVIINSMSAIHTPQWIRGEIRERNFNK